jgi:carboxymethylenebutenolidase
VPNEQITIRTRDGECTLRIATPAADGSWPAVIFYMDAGGIRPAVIEMAQRLADAGYVVLLPDLFYRYGAYGPFVPKEVFAGDFRAILGPLMATTGTDKAAEDTEAFLASLDARGDVAGRKVGAVGFCMGGGMALAAAGTYPDRFGAVVSFHGGNLATDAPTSPTCWLRGWGPRSILPLPRTTAAIRLRWQSDLRTPWRKPACVTGRKPTPQRTAG